MAPALAGQLPRASAATLPSRPIVWVSGQDAGLVFVVDTASGTFKTFDFAHGGGTANPATPAVPGIGGHTPGLDVASPKPHLIQFSPDGRIAYVTLQNTNPGVFAAIDTQTFAVHLFTMPANGTPSTRPSKVTEVKASPNGTVLFVGEIGDDKTPGGGIGVLTKITTDEPTNPSNPSFTVVKQLTFANGGLPSAADGPACSQFSPDGTRAYVDSSLEAFKGVLDVDPVAMTVTGVHPTIGDPQCGFHDPVILNGVPTIVVTDNGNGVTGHVHLIDTTQAIDSFTEVAPSPVPAKNLHDNWPVQLEPVGAPTTDPANTVYATDRDSNTLHQMRIGTTTDNVLTMTDPFVPPNPGITGFAPRPAPDTADGSGDTVFVVMKEFGDLGIVDGFSTQSFIHLVNPDPSCGTPGDPNFHKCFTVHALTVQPNRALTQVNVAAGTTRVISHTKITGSIIVQPGGALDLEDSTVTGSVVANGPSSFRMCNSTTGGSVTVTGATGFVLVGDPADDGCGGNTIHGSLSLRNNTHGAEALGNTVTTVFASGNSGTGPFPEDTSPDIQ